MNLPPFQFIMDRAVPTHECMVVIGADWVWEKISVAAFLGKIDAAEALLETQSAEGAQDALARGTRNTGLATLRGKMRTQVRLAKKHWKTNAAKMAVLRGVKTNSNGVAATLKQAMDWEKAWGQLDAAWVPTAGDTLAAFGIMRAACAADCGTVATESAEDAEAGGDVFVAMKELWTLCVDWYGEALIRFGPETAHGIMIRDEIPTLETPPPGQAVITSAVLQDSTHVKLIYDAPHGTSFDVLYQSPAEEGYNAVATGILAKEFVAAVVTGDNTFKVIPHNSHGPGPESDVTTVTA